MHAIEGRSIIAHEAKGGAGVTDEREMRERADEHLNSIPHSDCRKAARVYGELLAAAERDAAVEDVLCAITGTDGKYFCPFDRGCSNPDHPQYDNTIEGIKAALKMGPVNARIAVVEECCKAMCYLCGHLGILGPAKLVNGEWKHAEIYCKASAIRSRVAAKGEK